MGSRPSSIFHNYSRFLFFPCRTALTFIIIGPMWSLGVKCKQRMRWELHVIPCWSSSELRCENRWRIIQLLYCVLLSFLCHAHRWWSLLIQSCSLPLSVCHLVSIARCKYFHCPNKQEIILLTHRRWKGRREAKRKRDSVGFVGRWITKYDHQKNIIGGFFDAPKAE